MAGSGNSCPRCGRRISQAGGACPFCTSSQWTQPPAAPAPQPAAAPAWSPHRVPPWAIVGGLAALAVVGVILRCFVFGSGIADLPGYQLFNSSGALAANDIRPTGDPGLAPKVKIAI